MDLIVKLEFDGIWTQYTWVKLTVHNQLCQNPPFPTGTYELSISKKKNL